ncbi:cell wall-active antibiotics response protein LiaF [Streptococcus caprae]|uniref:Cell wall-active antibiotics response protein LiaF n=1 Tax=Streptococcus caprae TaxID=1640501 RepID=A0ABV8CXF7_9STRE
MKKFQLFLLVEAVLLSMAFMTILSSDVPSFVLLLVVVLLATHYYSSGQRNNFLLTASLLVLFLIFMLNPYVIAAVLVGVVYVMINYFSQVKDKNRYAFIKFREDEQTIKPIANQWIGYNEHLLSDAYGFDDINITRLSGTDVIDLNRVIVTGRDNVVLIRKIYGPTQILVPIDVSVKLDINSIYGSVKFFDKPEYDLRNTTLKIAQDDYYHSNRTVKIIISVLAGTVEVKRV